MMGRSYVERFDQIMDILLEGTIPTSRKADAIAAILDLTTSFPKAPPEVSLFQAEQLIELANQGLLTSAVQQPLKGINCTLYNLLRPNVKKPFITVGPVLISPYAGLGRPFGPELTFSHALAKMSLYKNHSIVKVIAGGTQLYKDWSSAGGKYWNDINSTIHSLDATKDEWKGIVWFQGENDAFNASEANNYLTNLTHFIDDLRREIHSANQLTTNIPSYRDLPVTIVECGYWVADRTPFGRTVIQAQKDFVASDDSAVLVQTDDLARYSHYDEASPLIVGSRIAKAFVPLLERAATITRPNGTRATKPPTVKSTTQPPTVKPTTQPQSKKPTTPRPTLYPSTSPTPASPICFSGENIVQVKDIRGKVLMKDLRLGDQVLVEAGKYEVVYSFGHRDETSEAPFLRLLPSNLEISMEHMVKIAGGRYVPASAAHVGDKLETATAGDYVTITGIETVVRKGVYAPFTMSGTIVVSDIQASNYVAFQHSDRLVIGGWASPLSYQWLAHLSQAPHRIWVLVFGIREEEMYTDSGMSTWIDGPHWLGEVFVVQHPLMMTLILIPVVSCLFVVSVIETVLTWVIGSLQC